MATEMDRATMVVVVVVVVRQHVGNGVHVQGVDMWYMMVMAVMVLVDYCDLGSGDSDFGVTRATRRMVDLDEFFDRRSMSGMSMVVRFVVVMVVMVAARFGRKSDPAHAFYEPAANEMLYVRARIQNVAAGDGCAKGVRSGDMWMKKT